MKTQTIVLILLLSLILPLSAFVVFSFVGLYVASRLPFTSPPLVSVESVMVLVAIEDSPQGTVLTEPQKKFKYKPVIKGEEPKMAVNSYDQLKDKMLNKSISAEQFCTPKDLSDNAGPDLIPGQRAVAIRINPAKDAAGLLPGKRVDVLYTEQVKGKPVARIVVQDVLILAVDTILSKPPPEFVTVTIAISPEQAVKLAEVWGKGTLSLVRRAPDDAKKE